MLMAEALELPRVRRRPQPRARLARLRLEAQIFRRRLVRQNLRFTTNQLQAIDAERRIADYRGVPSRAALIRALIDAGMTAICAQPPAGVDVERCSNVQSLRDNPVVLPETV